MKKFKKIMLGALSVLTLGLFAVVGTKVDAKGSVETNDIFIGNFNNMSSKILTYSATSSTSSNKMTFTSTKGKDSVSGISNTYGTDGYDIDFSLTSGAATLKSENEKVSFTTTNNWSAEVYYAFLGTQNGYTQGIQTNIGTISVPENSTAKNILYKATISSGIAGDVEITRTGNKETIIYEIVVTQKNVINTYDIIYNLGGHGSSISTAEDKIALSASELPELDDVVEGNTTWTFDGWYLNNNFTTKATTSTNLDDYDVNGDVTLYAHWIDANATYNVTFMNGSEQYGNVISIPYDSNNVATIGNLMPSNPTKDGYIFDGWYTADGTNDVWGNKVTSSTEITASMVNDKAITLYAKFSVDPVVNATFDNYTDFAKLPTSNIADDISDVVINSYLTAPGSKNYFVKAKTNTTTFNDNVTLTNQVQTKRLVLTLSTIAKVDIYAQQTGSASRTIKVINTQNGNVVGSFIPSGTSNKNVFTIYLAPGTYNLDGYEGETLSNINFFGAIIDTSKKLSDNTTASVFAEKNTAGDKLKFVGTLTGITDLDNIGSIELILTLDGVATAKQIFLKTCYTSVSDLSENAPECGEVTNTYYTIYRISGVSGLKGTITKQLKVTFTDGSTTTSELTEIVLK